MACLITGRGGLSKCSKRNDNANSTKDHGQSPIHSAQSLKACISDAQKRMMMLTQQRITVKVLFILPKV